MTARSIVASDLHVRLGRREVLAGIDLAIAAGQLTIMVGPNGAGKTTLMRTVAGLVTPHRGAATIAGESIHGMGRSTRARTLAYLPQTGSLSWPLPVQDVVALGRLPHGEQPGRLPRRGQKAVSDAIAAVGLDGFEARPATDISGGERARVLLARALATEAPVLLADEPVAALDPRHQLLVLALLRERARAGSTILAIMHDLGLAARFADHIVLIDGRRIEAAGPPEEVLTEARLAKVFGIEASVSRQADGLAIVTKRAIGRFQS